MNAGPYLTDTTDAICPQDQGLVDQRPAWKWRDIVIGVSLPVGLYGLAFAARYCPPMPLWVYIPFALAFLFIPAAYSIWIYRRKFNSTPLPRVTAGVFLKESIWAFLYVLLLILFYFGITFLLKTISDYHHISEWEQRLGNYMNKPVVFFGFLFFSFAVAPVCEELFFRGFLYTALKSHMRWIAAGILQALFFAVLHGYDWFGTTAVFVAGLSLACLYEHRKTLLTPILAHAQLNFIFAAFMAVFFVLNHHTPAQDWEQAQLKPVWFEEVPAAYIEKQSSGEEQRLYAIEVWGSQGLKLWKREINAMNAVLVWFPDEQDACYRAKLGISHIYLQYLQDYRRAVLEADDLLTNYTGDRETRAEAWLNKALGYYYLGESDQCRQCAEVIVSDYQECEYELHYATDLLQILN